jgi:hypothetical protein
MFGNILSALRFRNVLLSLILLCSLSAADAAVCTLEWDDDLNTDPEKPVYYMVCWGASPGNYKLGQSSDLTGKQYAFDQPDGLYFVSVRAFYDGIEIGSPYSNEVIIGGKPGDVDNSRVVDLKDAVLSLQIAAGIYPASAVTIGGDSDNDGKIGLPEAIYTLINLGAR